MSIEISDIDLLSDYEADIEESLTEELEDLLPENFLVPSTRPTSLASKLTVANDFPVSVVSTYRGECWSFPISSMRAPINIYFNSEMSGFPDLQRAVVYYVIPEFSPFNSVRSFNTTKDFNRVFNLVERLLLTSNHLNATPSNLALITGKMINEALDRARASDTPAHYYQLYRALSFWASLSDQGLMPDELRLPVTLDSFAYKERKKDVIDHYALVMKPWQAYSENELEELLNYALLWTEKAVPALERAANNLTRFNWDKDKKRINREVRDPEIEALTYNVDGVDIFSITSSTRTVTRAARTFATFTAPARTYEKITYTWLTPFGQSLDNIRNALFILIALLTGARISELDTIRFSDVWKAENNEYWIRIRRWKTSTDPNYNGDVVEIPIPFFLGEMVMRFKSLWEFRVSHSFPREDWLFGSNLGRRPATTQYNNVRGVIEKLKDLLPIDNLHCHRFRKTIAEILINRDERNIEIIRCLFGHDSYEMTVRYIARNPFMVRDVAIAFETAYSEDLYAIIREVSQGSYSGQAAERIAASVDKDKSAFEGKALKLTVLRYVTHLLMAGEPIFIKRTAVGTFCVNGDSFDEDNAPPCARNDKGQVISEVPDPSNCHYECRNIVVLSKAKQAIMDNIKFCNTLITTSGSELSAKAQRLLASKIKVYEEHLLKLNNNFKPEAFLPEVVNEF
jgi:integrase